MTMITIIMMKMIMMTMVNNDDKNRPELKMMIDDQIK